MEYLPLLTAYFVVCAGFYTDIRSSTNVYRAIIYSVGWPATLLIGILNRAKQRDWETLFRGIPSMLKLLALSGALYFILGLAVASR